MRLKGYLKKNLRQKEKEMNKHDIDKIKQLENIFPNIKTSNDSSELVRITKEYLSLTEKELNNIKEENRQNILDNHCYTNRVKQLLSL